jgi:hypothetical protein
MKAAPGPALAVIVSALYEIDPTTESGKPLVTRSELIEQLSLAAGASLSRVNLQPALKNALGGPSSNPAQRVVIPTRSDGPVGSPTMQSAALAAPQTVKAGLSKASGPMQLTQPLGFSARRRALSPRFQMRPAQPKGSSNPEIRPSPRQHSRTYTEPILTRGLY